MSTNSSRKLWFLFEKRIGDSVLVLSTVCVKGTSALCDITSSFCLLPLVMMPLFNSGKVFKNKKNCKKYQEG